MTLDYRFPYDVQVLTGDGLDLSSCLFSLQIASQAFEPESVQDWSAQITLRLSAAAEQAGITGSSLDPIASPARWAQGVGKLTLVFAGLTTAVFRIDSWRYDAQSKTAEGTLSQQIRLYDVPVPDLSPDIVYADGSSIVSAKDTVAKLLAELTARCTQPFVYDSGSFLPSCEYSFYGMRSTRSPIAEAQTLLKPKWAWLTQSLQTEQVTIVQPTYDSLPIAFVRTADQAEIVPDSDNLSFAAPKVMVVGSADYPDEDANCGSAGSSGGGSVQIIVVDTPENVDDKGRPISNTTESKEPAGKIFPQVAADPAKYGFSYEVPQTSQRKLVEYFYYDLPPNLPGFHVYKKANILNMPSWYDAVPTSNKPWPAPVLNESTGLWATRTTIYEPRGKVFPDVGVDFSLIKSSVLVETGCFKVTYKTYGQLFPEIVKRPGNAYLKELLTIDNIEVLKNDYVQPGKNGGRIDGRHACVEPSQPDIPQPVKLVLKPKLFSAEASVDRSYVPALDYPAIFNYDFIPDDASATLLVNQLAIRETSRSLADTIRMPVPIEWLAQGLPSFCKAHIGNKVYSVEAPVFELSVSDDGSVSGSLSFTGCPLTLASEPPAQPAPAMFVPMAGESYNETDFWPDQVYSLRDATLAVQLL